MSSTSLYFSWDLHLNSNYFCNFISGIDSHLHILLLVILKFCTAFFGFRQHKCWHNTRLQFLQGHKPLFMRGDLKWLKMPPSKNIIHATCLAIFIDIFGNTDTTHIGFISCYDICRLLRWRLRWGCGWGEVCREYSNRLVISNKLRIYQFYFIIFILFNIFKQQIASVCSWYICLDLMTVSMLSPGYGRSKFL